LTQGSIRPRSVTWQANSGWKTSRNAPSALPGKPHSERHIPIDAQSLPPSTELREVCGRWPNRPQYGVGVVTACRHRTRRPHAGKPLKPATPIDRAMGTPTGAPIRYSGGNRTICPGVAHSSRINPARSMMGEPSAPVAAGIRVVSRRDQGCLD